MVEIHIPKRGKTDVVALGNLRVTELPDDMLLLEDLEKEIANSIFHLKRSNDEICEFDPTAKDVDMQLALAENAQALTTKEARLARVQAKIESLRNAEPSQPAAGRAHTAAPAPLKTPPPHASPNEHGATEPQPHASCASSASSSSAATCSPRGLASLSPGPQAAPAHLDL
eukprot:GHVT01088441.1.p1 GENE.GHVT01088441.1~~GHVT01088441.1.p1  ORF type:complete len:171 (+),score=50.48 GHVT01088441.1:630-1142(+)